MVPTHTTSYDAILCTYPWMLNVMIFPLCFRHFSSSLRNPVRSKLGDSALIVASDSEGSHVVVPLLLRLGANPDAVNTVPFFSSRRAHLVHFFRERSMVGPH